MFIKFSTFALRIFTSIARASTSSLFLLLFCVFFVSFVFPLAHADASDHFITTWKTNNAGSSNSTSITIPTTGGGYNYDVDWDNDGIFDQMGITGNVTHDFGVADTYTISIRGTFPRIYFNNEGDKLKILSINQWGSNAWSSMNKAFSGAANLTLIATDTPNLVGVTDMSSMFLYAASFNSDIGNWNVSNVTDMSSMFLNATTFNGDIGNWNVSKVTNMAYMFGFASAFNQDIGAWDTRSLTNTAFMFYNATAFNQDIGDWDVSAMTVMLSTFYNATAFNQNIGSWNVGNVTNMQGTFQGASSFNQDIGNWNTSKVTTMYGMFASATAFNQNISSWNVSKVTTMQYMFTSVALSYINYDALLTGWSSQVLKPSVNFSAGNSKYCDQAKRDILTSAPNNWIITDGGPELVSCGLVSPDAPTITTVTSGNTQVTIAFTAPASNGGSALTDYIIEYKLTSEPTTWSTFTDGTSTTTSATVTGLSNGSSYDFRVSAVNAIGTSTPSTSATATPATTPGAPTITTVTAGNTQVTIAFTAPASDGGSAITNYTVTASPGGATASGSSSPITVTGLTNGTTYTFTITATNSIGTSSASSASNSVIPVTTPNPPTSLTLTRGNTEVALSFTAPASNGGSALTDYIIEYKLTSEPTTWLTFTDGTSTTTSATVTGLTNGSSYDFRVSAVNAIGTSTPSTSATATPATVPGVPNNLTTSVESSSIGLLWSVPSSHGGSALTDYIIEYKLTSEPTTWSTFTDGTSTTRNTTVTGLANRSSYDFRVSAVNAVGASTVTSTVTATPGEPAQVLILDFPDLVGPTIGTSVRITNEGVIAYEYQYTWCVTNALDNLCGGGDDVFSSGAAKLVQVNQDWDTTLNSTVSSTGNYWFHFSVIYGSTSSSAHQSFTISTISSAPNPPTSLTLTRGNTEVALSFTAPASNGGSALTDYIIEYKLTSEPTTWLTFTDGTSTTTSATVTGLTNGSSYDFRVSAVNAIGTGAVSNTSVSTPMAPVSLGSGGGGGGGGGYSITTLLNPTVPPTPPVTETPTVPSTPTTPSPSPVTIFTDTSSSFAQDDIDTLFKRGIIQGYEDGTFRPENPITRAEFLAITMKSLNIETGTMTTTSFTDIPADAAWMIPLLEKARTLGIVKGQTINGRLMFRPNDSISRGEAVTILLNAAKIPVDLSITQTTFQDIPTNSEWMIPYITKAQSLGIINGQIIDGILKFRPNDSITRAESVRVITGGGESEVVYLL